MFKSPKGINVKIGWEVKLSIDFFGFNAMLSNHWPDAVSFLQGVILFCFPTIFHMLYHHSNSLHIRINNRGAHKFESSLF